MESWTALNLVAWIFGLTAVYDLRGEFPPNARTWVWLTWAVWACLLMDLAMAGMAYLDGLALVSVLTGVGSGCLLWLAFRSLHADLQSDCSRQLAGAPRDRRYALILGGTAAASIALARILPDVHHAIVEIGLPLEGAVWLGASGWLAVVMLRRQADAPPHYYRARAFGVAFAFSFISSSLTPLGLIADRRVAPAIGRLFSTLFILTLVTALYALVLRVRGAKMAATLTQLHDAREHLMTVERLVTVGTLAAGAAHDFNNSLMAISAHSELALQDRSLSKETREDIESILEAAFAATALTSNLLGIARRSVDGSCRDLREAVQAPLAGITRELERQRIEVVTHCEPVPPPRRRSSSVVPSLPQSLHQRARRDASQGGRQARGFAANGRRHRRDPGQGHRHRHSGGIPTTRLPTSGDDEGRSRHRARPRGLQIDRRGDGRTHLLRIDRGRGNRVRHHTPCGKLSTTSGVASTSCLTRAKRADGRRSHDGRSPRHGL